MVDWINTAIYFFLVNITIFLLGAYGIQLFTRLHNVIINCKATTFGGICNIAAATLLIFLLWKIS